MRNQDKYNINNVRQILFKNGITLIDNKYIDVKTKMLCMDNEGYYIYIILSNFLSRHGVGRRFDKSNDHAIENINHYLEINNIHFRCISEKFHNANDPLTFKCLLCGEEVITPWRNVNKKRQSQSHSCVLPQL